jgi:hypothetical protein
VDSIGAHAGAQQLTTRVVADRQDGVSTAEQGVLEPRPGRLGVEMLEHDGHVGAR